MLQISLTTFRDLKLTEVARRTGSVYEVMRVSGHKKVETTQFYVDLSNVIYGKSEYDEYNVRIASNAGEAAALIERGFDYVTGDYDDGGKLFRKRKIDYDEAGSTL